MTAKKFGTDLTVGSIPRHLLKFSIPLLLGNLIQIGHSIVNTIWVGHLVGENAVGASGVTFPIYFVTIGLAMGLTMATTILVSQYYGAKDFAKVERVVNNSFSLALIVGGAMTIGGILAGDQILHLIKAPPENFVMASGYLKLTFCSTILMFMMFAISSVLRGIGDTITPMLFMAIGIGMNIIIDPFFIGGFGPFPSHGLNGAAYATLASQSVAMAASLIYLSRKGHFVAFNPKKLVLDKDIILLILKMGLPSIVQQFLVSVASLLILTIINSFGSSATNAIGAVNRVDMFAFMPAMSISSAVAALTGQNIGAGKEERVKDVFKWGVIMSSAMTILVSLVAVSLSGVILRMFGLGDDKEVMTIGMNFLRIVGSSYVLVGIMFVAGGVINGSGHTIVTMAVSILGFWAMRVPAAWLLSGTALGINGIWVAIVLSFAMGMTLSLVYYYSGRWKEAVITRTAEVLPFME